MVDALSAPRHALDPVWLECGSSPQHNGMGVESRLPHKVLLSRRPTTSSGPDDPRHTSTSRVRVVCVLHCVDPSIVSYEYPRSPAASYSEQTRLKGGRRPRDAAQFPASGTPSPASRLRLPEIEKAPPQPEVRHTDPNQAQLPPSQGIRGSPRPVRRPSADPVLAQPTIFASSGGMAAMFAVFSARRDEARRANDTPGSQ
ncbi:hypothetical protein THAOC_09512 [Thalassiosira oceanica]|uniref:Uncharacterized protein n=1 Tax=Thalassiosira oceanica TaxID=159749 RepID=K0T7H3_THAOC|nr:hypothetical protein THAOC_09512 [Thalassiosira oceanica]|eukprot:EJK69246.1 hypothetical protein THAOC_09512 [Thalassiosira oceanica]